MKLHGLGIASLAHAEDAAREGRLRRIKGLGASVERKILEGVAIVRSAEGSMRANRAEELLAHAAEAVRSQGIDMSQSLETSAAVASWFPTSDWSGRRMKQQKHSTNG